MEDKQVESKSQPNLSDENDNFLYLDLDIQTDKLVFDTYGKVVCLNPAQSVEVVIYILENISLSEVDKRNIIEVINHGR